jgi:hypothetical protein
MEKPAEEAAVFGIVGITIVLCLMLITSCMKHGDDNRTKRMEIRQSGGTK